MWPLDMSGSSASAGDAPPPTTSVTASTIVAEVVSGSHVLKIDGFSQTIGASDGGSYVKSGRFVVGGHGWRVGARFKISLLAAAHDGSHPPPPRSDQSTATRSFPRFITAKALEESGYLPPVRRRRREGYPHGGRRHHGQEARRRAAAVRHRLVGVLPPSDIGAHLGRLLAAGHGADVAIHVGGETFAAHRCVLAARSPVFMAELFGPMAMSRHNNEETIRVHDMEPRVFEAMLHFIYNDSLPEVDDDDDGEVAAMAQHLLVAADRYDMGRLKLICEDTLCSHVDASTAATALTLAEQHHCERLKEACFKFMENPSNLKAVMASDDFLHLTRSCSSLLKKLAKLAA
uniref:BTB domain-containing protein n=1 Tax=Oryza barthii TaxID=65489 RepID=A0A0D3FE40_9ORYZ